MPNQANSATLRFPYKHWLMHANIPPLPQQLAVGWSGGADSTALLLALKDAGHDVQAWHVDHSWRDSSQREAELLRNKAASWGITFINGRLPSPSGKNREAEARHGRLAQFQKWGHTTGISTLCLAQHLDDQAETVCMRLLQGAGAGGCQGMRHERLFGELRIVRPLLHVPAQDLRQALIDTNISWFEDPSNRDMSIWRNRIRHQLFPRMEKAGISPQSLFLRWQQQADILIRHIDLQADALWQPTAQNAQNIITIPWLTWKSCSSVIRARLLQKMMAHLLGDGITPGRRHIELVETWTTKSGRGGVDLSRCRLYRKRGCLHLQPTRADFAHNN
ncbi:tRNA lysidine(34) synthetase TilS [Mariprofundus sp. EBB-1]|uniref:tRNA lysidine(34) synthetase TilS n=1 Tax=Mariprofundus sp. EBB-1 TaxID=2650971 RepID=UPI001F2E63F0|nr:tRNA lysidine(34) synthetase TilS [Mariprofundus sp. EBB-1]